jgi:hypothetical protein
MFVARSLDSYRKLLLSYHENKFERASNQVQLYLMDRKQATERDLYRRFGVSVSFMESILKKLNKEEKVTIEEVDKGKKVVKWL